MLRRLRLALLSLVAAVLGVRPAYASRRQLGRGRFAGSAVAVDLDEDWVLIVSEGRYLNHHNGPHEVTREHLEQMLAHYETTSTELHVDYDHRSIYDGDTKASGWSAELRLTDRGLEMKRPEFTAAARQAIEDREYRYFSPVYVLESEQKDGTPGGARLVNVALTSLPYFDQHEIDPIGNNAGKPDPDEGSQPPLFMEREKLIEMLGLPADATDDQIEAALKAKKQEPENKPDAELEAAKANSAKPEGDDVADRIAALETKLQAQETASTEAAAKTKADELVDAAVTAGKVLPADREVFVNSALSDFEATKGVLDKREAGSALGRRTVVSSKKAEGAKVNAGSPGHAYLDKVLG